MSYPPPNPGGYGYPSQQQQPPQGYAAGFGQPQPQQQQQPQPGQGTNYSMYPPSGGGFPCPPANPPAGAPYSSPQGAQSYQPMPGQPPASYPPQGNTPAMPYAPGSQPTYGMPPTNTSGSPYPGASGSNPYPSSASQHPQSSMPPGQIPPPGAAAGYPPQPSTSPVPPFGGANPYSATPASGAYPSQGTQYPGGASPYPPAGGSPYPTGGGASYPPMGGAPSGYPGSGGQHQAYSQNQAFQTQTGSGLAGALWPYQERPTLRPAVGFDPSADAAELHKAMKGFGTDEAGIIRVLARRTSEQRQQIIMRYQQSFGKELMRDLNGELSGDFGSAIQALMTPLSTYLAKELYRAVSGIGTNERTLIEILCANDNASFRPIKVAYESLYRKPVEADLRGDTSGYFQRLLVAMATAFRDEAGTNTSVAPQLAQNLYAAGVKKLGTDEGEFIRILSTYSYPVLRCVFDEYTKVSGGKSFESAIKSELSGDIKDGMLSIYECIVNRANFLARCLHQTMSGAGTRDQSLIRIVVSRAEVDLGNVKDEYMRRYGKRLEDAVASETSGDYKKLLLAIMQE